MDMKIPLDRVWVVIELKIKQYTIACTMLVFYIILQ